MTGNPTGVVAGVRQELARSLAPPFDRETAASVAGALLERDTRAHLLIGVRRDGPTANLYHWPVRSIAALPLAEEGIDGLGAYRLRDADARPSVEAWVAAMGEEPWAWLHPRFRWVLEEDGESDA